MSVILALDRPLDLRATVGVFRQGRRDPTLRCTTDTLVWASRTPEGPGTLRVRFAGGRLGAEAWGPGGDWQLAHVPDLFGEYDDPSGFAPDHPVVQRAWHRHPGLRCGRTLLIVPSLVAAVLGQRVTSKESVQGWATLCYRLGGRAPGPEDVWLPPDPEALAGQPTWWYHRLGIERRRADTLRRIGRHAGRLQEAAALSLDDAARRLRAVSGVGPWTAAEVLSSALGDPDAVSVGDYHLPHQVAWALAGEPRADDARMLELLAPFAGHRRRVVRLLLADGHRAPRFGPRQGIRPIASL